GLSNIDSVLEQIGEGPICESDTAYRLFVRQDPFLCENLFGIQIVDKFSKRPRFNISIKNITDRFRIGFIYNELLVYNIITKRNASSHPFPLFARSGKLVTDALGRQFSFELGKREKNVKCQSSQRARRAK